MLEMETIEGIRLNVRQLSWAESRLILQKADPTLVEIIDELSPPRTFFLYLATYVYGATIVKNGRLHFNTKYRESIPCDDILIPARLQKKLGYNPITQSPLAVLVERVGETYLPVNNNAYPLDILRTGDLLCPNNISRDRVYNLTPFMQPAYNLTTIVAGVRSIFMVPKISDSFCHQNIKKRFKVTLDAPKSFMEHGAIFRDIVHGEKTGWKTKILIFGNDWIEKLSDPAWARFTNHLLHKILTKHKSAEMLEVSSVLSYIDQKRNLRFNAMTLNMAKHLLNIAVGNAPCFRPSMDNEMAPIKLIQSAYVKHYGLTDYFPLLMEPTIINPNQPRDSYYFSNCPTLPQLAPESYGNKAKSIINTIKDVKYIIDMYQNSLTSDAWVSNSAISYQSRCFKFSYYHNDVVDETDGIYHIDSFFKHDSRFNALQIGAPPIYSPVLRGCIKIHHNKSRM